MSATIYYPHQIEYLTRLEYYRKYDSMAYIFSTPEEREEYKKEVFMCTKSGRILKSFPCKPLNK
jgi:hypothetical protein